MDIGRVVERIAERVPRNNDTHIGEDGLAYCNQCGTARQCRVELFGKVQIVPCICRCMSEGMDREEAERKKRERELELERYRSLGFACREMCDYTFRRDDGSAPDVAKAMKRYVENFDRFLEDGKGLLLWGDVGTGKTFFAACAVNALIDSGYPCLMTNFSRLTNAMQKTWTDKQEYIDSLSRFSLVAIDDLGVERDTEYMSENVTTIIDALYRSKTPMIITSNFTPKELVDVAEIRKRRVYDRLLERCFPIKVNAPSRRKQKGREDFSEMKTLLGF